MIVDSTNPRIMADNIRELARNGGGSDLPEVTAADNGKVLGVVEGSWNKMDAPSGAIDYSATEQNTGRKWIDGKDIYSITISGVMSAGVNFTEDLTDLNIDTIVDFEVIGKNETYNVSGYYASTTDMFNYFYKADEKTFTAYPADSGFFGTVYVTLYYTKATTTRTKKKTTTKGEN